MKPFGLVVEACAQVLPVSDEAPRSCTSGSPCTPLDFELVEPFEETGYWSLGFTPSAPCTTRSENKTARIQES